MHVGAGDAPRRPQEANQQFVVVRDSNEQIKQRENALRALDQAYYAFTELQSHLKDGMKVSCASTVRPLAMGIAGSLPCAPCQLLGWPTHQTVLHGL